MKELRILSPTAILGYGFPLSSFEAGMAKKPDVIAVDGGSTDPGPYYIGSGKSFTDRTAVKRDLEIMIKAALLNNIPVIVGSAGGSGAKSHLDWCADIVREIAREGELSFKLALIEADIDKELVLHKLEEGHIRPLYPAKQLQAYDILKTTNVVAQMGIEPMVEALNEGADVILAGRAYDPTSFAALAAKNGMNMGLALHLGKILECAAIASTPGSGSDCMIGYLYEDCFKIEPLNPIRKCTTLSVAAHTLYEKTNPYFLPGPGGMLDLSETTFEQETENMVRVAGTKFIPSEVYTIKLEGAKRIGYRTVSIAGTRDAIMIKEIDHIIAAVKERVEDNFSQHLAGYHLNINIYGKNGVMGALEPTPIISGHEIGIIIEAVASSQEDANTICSFARSTMLHFGYDGRIATAGNLAFPYSPSDFQGGEVYNFTMYHVMEIDDPTELFPITYEYLGSEV